MDNKYNSFLCFGAVINIKNETEFQEFVSLMKKLGLSQISYMEKINSKYGFEKGFCYSGGIKKFEPKDLCFEYQLGKGFTFSDKQGYLKYDEEMLICTIEDIKEATGYGIRIDKIFIEKPNTDVAVYMRFNSEEDYKKFYKIDEIEKMIQDINSYVPIDGFYDLRNFAIPEDRFKELWKIQLYFKEYLSNKIALATVPNGWENLKELSKEYQKELNSYPKKASRFHEFELDMEREG